MFTVDTHKNHEYLLEFFIKLGYSIEKIKRFKEDELSKFITAVLMFDKLESGCNSLRQYVDGFF